MTISVECKKIIIIIIIILMMMKTPNLSLFWP